MAAEAATTTAIRRMMVSRMLVTAAGYRLAGTTLDATGVDRVTPVRSGSESGPGRGHTGAHVWARYVRTVHRRRADLQGHDGPHRQPDGRDGRRRDHRQATGHPRAAAAGTGHPLGAPQARRPG